MSLSWHGRGVRIVQLHLALTMRDCQCSVNAVMTNEAVWPDANSMETV